MSSAADFCYPGILKGRRIIFILDHFDIDGPVRQALLLADSLRSNEQADVNIWALRPRTAKVDAIGGAEPSIAAAALTPGPGAEACEALSLPWRLVPGQSWESGMKERMYSTARLAWELRAARPDIVLPYVTTACLACGLTWRATGARLCVWNQRDEGLGLGGNRLLKLLAVRLTPLFISNSSHAADLLIRDFQAPGERVHIVANGVMLPAESPNSEAARKLLGIQADDFVAGMIANITRRKDHRTLLLAWRHVVEAARARSRTALLLLAGRPDDEYRELIALVDDLDITNNVVFLGQVADVHGVLAACDIGVHSSWLEGCPNGVLESMAQGLAVAATDIPGIREALGPTAVGCVAPRQDDTMLADVIVALMDDDERRRRIGEANRVRIAESFGIQAMCKRYTNLIAAGLVANP